jgi:PucR family transcriptional regulator, purine catabolism regulatory protein
MNQPLPSETITLGDVLRLTLPLSTTFRAGAGQARRQINWVALLTDWAQLPEEARAGDLVILPPALQNQVSETDLKEGVRLLNTLSAAALLLFYEPPAAVIRLASSLELPLLIVPPATPLRDVHRGITALLLDKQAQTTDRGMQLYRRLSEISREGQGLAAMIDIMARLTGKIVAVQDKRLEIQAISYPPNSVAAEFTAAEATLRDLLCQRDNLPAVLRNRKAAAKARQSHWQQLLPVANPSTSSGQVLARLVSPIIAGDRARGYLSVIGPPDALDLLDTLIVEHGAAACALEMAKAKAVSEAKKSLRGDFLEALLAGSLPKREIERLAGRLDHDTTQPHAIMTFAWEGAVRPSLRRMETTVNWLISSYDQPALVHSFADSHICVFQALRREEESGAAQEFARRLREQLLAEYPDARLIGGLSGPARSLPEWPDVYQQALRAMQLGRRLGLNNLVEFNSLGIYQLLTQLEGLPAVQSFCRQLIGPLAQYDQRHRSNLVQTMEAYFKHHGNISQTAEALFVHRNTLLYRLERIQELTGQQLDQADMRLAFHLALKLWQLNPADSS